MFKGKETIKHALLTALPVCMSSALCFTSYASDGGTSITDSVSTSLITAVTDIASSIGGIIGKVIPLALPLIGAGLVVTVGLKVFKKVTHQA